MPSCFRRGTPSGTCSPGGGETTVVDLRCANLRICAPRRISKLPWHLTVSLHDEDRQKKDIDDYFRFFVYSDRHMRRWRVEDKDRVTRKPSFLKSRDDNPHAFAAAVFDGSSANWERCVTAFHQ